MNLVRSSLKLFLAKILGSLSSFAAVIVFSRELGASPLGTYYPFLALLGIISIPANFGINSAAEKRLSEGSDLGQYLTSAILLKTPLLLLASLIIIAASGYIETYLGANLTWSLVFALFVREGSRLSLAILRGELRVDETAVVEVLRPLGWLIVGYILYINGFGVHGLVYGYIVGSLAMMIVGWWKVSVSLSYPSIEHARSLIDYGRFSVIGSIGGYFYSWVDIAILTLFVTLGIVSSRAEIGAYENAWRVSMIVLIFSRSIALTVFPQISKWDADEATEQIESIIPTTILPAVLIVIPAFAGTIVLSREILSILFSPEFSVAWLALIILMGEKVFQAVHTIFARCLEGIDRPDLAAYSTLVSIAINIGLNTILIWQLGIVGAAIATSVSFIINTGIKTYYLRKFINIELPIKETLWSLVASALMAICIYWVKLTADIQNILHLVGIVVLGAVIYMTIALAFSPIRIYIRNIAGPAINS